MRDSQTLMLWERQTNKLSKDNYTLMIINLIMIDETYVWATYKYINR